MYLGDHGESPGENKLYLHGLPCAIAPDVQKRVPMMIRPAGPHSRFRYTSTSDLKVWAKGLSHDNIFHTIPAMMRIETAFYNKRLDLSAA